MQKRTLDVSSLGDFLLKPAIVVPKNPILKSDAAVFTMGSCFAQEIR